MASADFRGPYTGTYGSGGAANNVWHKGPTMFAGGTLSAYRSGRYIYGTVTARSDIRTGSYYEYPVTVQVVFNNAVVCEFSNNGAVWEKSKDFTIDTTSGGNMYVRYICGQPGGCTVGYNTVYMVNKSTTYQALIYVEGITLTANASNSNVTPVGAKISWSSNHNIKTVEWKRSNESTWKTVQTGLNTSSGSFNVSGLSYNTNYTINVRLTAHDFDLSSSTSTTFITIDIARLKAVPSEWSIEEECVIDITNPGNCSMQLYLTYNGVEIISRNNISLVNGRYTLVLTDSEKNLLYNKSASDKNPSFALVLKSFISGTKIGEHSKSLSLTFPTKAWVKVNGVWKRALVWGKRNNTWVQCMPWVDPNKNKNWKRI
jgi:hypothetical protein